MTEPEGSKVGYGEKEDLAAKRAGVLRRGLMTVLKMGLAAGLLYWLFSRGAIDEDSLTRPLEFRLTISLMLALMALGVCMSGLRWWTLLRSEKIQVPLSMAIRLTFIGHFWNQVIPGAVSGDGVKMFYVGRLVPKDQREESWSTVFADRLIGLGALVSLSTFAALTEPDLFLFGDAGPRGMFLFMLLILSGFVSVGLVLWTGVGQEWRITAWVADRMPARETFGRVWHTLRRLGRRPKAVLLAYLISLLSHMISVTNAYLVGSIFTDALAPAQYYAVVPVAFFTNAIPLTPGGFGVGETVMGTLFGWVGAGKATPQDLTHAGVSVMVWVRLIAFAMAAVGGLLYAFYRGDGPGTPRGSAPAG